MRRVLIVDVDFNKLYDAWTVVHSHIIAKSIAIEFILA